MNLCNMLFINYLMEEEKDPDEEEDYDNSDLKLVPFSIDPFR